MTEFAIRTENLTRSFGTVQAVDKLTVEVPSGIIFGFLGPNGAGKTTTIHLLLGLLEPTDGQAKVLGFDTQTQADQIRQRTGVLLEHTASQSPLESGDSVRQSLHSRELWMGTNFAHLVPGIGDGEPGTWMRRAFALSGDYRFRQHSIKPAGGWACSQCWGTDLPSCFDRAAGSTDSKLCRLATANHPGIWGAGFAS